MKNQENNSNQSVINNKQVGDNGYTQDTKASLRFGAYMGWRRMSADIGYSIERAAESLSMTVDELKSIIREFD